MEVEVEANGEYQNGEGERAKNSRERRKKKGHRHFRGSALKSRFRSQSQALACPDHTPHSLSRLSRLLLTETTTCFSSCCYAFIDLDCEHIPL